jgi:hypothetical protein
MLQYTDIHKDLTGNVYDFGKARPYPFPFIMEPTQPPLTRANIADNGCCRQL